MDNIMKLKNKFNFILIEDACHAMFTKYKRKKFLGSYGDFSAFSFYANKNITSAEGGMLYCKNTKHAFQFEYKYKSQIKKTKFTVQFEQQYKSQLWQTYGN